MLRKSCCYCYSLHVGATILNIQATLQEANNW